MPREVQGGGTGNADARPTPRFFPATKAAPVMLPSEVRPLAPQPPPAQQPQQQQSVPPGNN